ncbi:MAG: DNA ligase D [Rhodomicrobiaceae bacterium]
MAKRQADVLGEYWRKRDFSRTSEPKGAASKAAGRAFVIQKHAARRTHFDFRLEHDGVLKSWAVTRGPSLDPADKRLAVRTEDHPLQYGSFEGVIPKGEYGAGPVMLWDEGHWEPLVDPDEGLEKGDLKFRLHGKRLQGTWVLVRMRSKPGEKRENWLLIKKADDYADEKRDVTEVFETSVATGRDMESIAEKAAPAKQKAGTRKTSRGAAKLPAFVKPQLATLVETPPDGEDWLHEIKYDGYRVIAAVAGDQVRLYTRSGQDWSDRFKQLVPAFQALELPGALIDGEVVVFDEKGQSRFGLLQDALKGGGEPMHFMAFDLLALDGHSLRKDALEKRKMSLTKLLKDAEGPIRYSDHVEGDGERMRAEVCAMGLEGIISKRGDAPYRSGRSPLWQKSKCIGRDEFVIGGWTPSKAAGRPFASLLLGEFDGDTLHYRGRVGTGFDNAEMDALGERLAGLSRKSSPFDDAPSAIARSARWVTPRLIAEVAYTERTRDGYLRHPAYLGLREDKPAKSVKVTVMPDSRKAASYAGVRLTSPDKVLFPEQGATKRDLAEYLVAMADHILPHLARRPLSLVRCPNGRTGECFFQKHGMPGFPDAFRRVEIKEKGGEPADYLYIEDEAGLAAAAQMGVLELHIWGAHIDKLEKPDRLVLDLDPAEDVPFSLVKTAAQDLRDVLSAAELQSFPLLTGGKGIHVVVPLERRQDWSVLKRFAAALARTLSANEPERFIAKATKAGRKGRIFIDWLRNERGATAIAPYSPRARKGAPVAAAVSWREMARIESADKYTLDTIAQRVKRLKGDPWEGYHEIRQSIRTEALAFVEKGGT